ncbi:methionine synthase [Amycolatopsis acidicola]|uniref:Methionine synthase n=1 Tax=Amycolatopsis acidicola TaxID=2596893 RepID=A0A5N0V242_9PSEU|nr:methionine synthase [Amycolatopsis acidicola]KAA9158706.1 methionine synthase [Amycolatopsis acidicola]
MADDFKYHIDHHVTLAPPAELAEARAVHAPASPDLRAAEDAAIENAVRMQRRVGVQAVGDGQFRRRHALSVVYDNVEGFGPAEDGGAVASLLGPRLAAEVRPLKTVPVRKNRLAEDEARFLSGVTGHPLMLSLPAPGWVLAVDGGDRAAGEALAGIVRDEIAALAGEGIVYIQLHNPVYSFLLSVAGAARARELGLDPASLLDEMLAADSAVLAGLEVPEDFRVCLDITTSAAADFSQGYDTEAVRTFLERQPFGKVCVEFLNAGFPLELLPAGLVISLGIVDVTDPAPESVDELLDLVDKAAEIVPIDDIALSTNGGFTGALTEDQEHAKLQLVEMTARYYWGNEL